MCGPLTAHRIAASVLLYAALALAGLALATFAGSARWRVFGLGIMAPGAGFAAYADVATWYGIAHVAAVALAIGLFLSAVLVWFANGNALAPPLTWLLAALAAAGMHHREPRPDAIWLVSVAVAGVILAVLAVSGIARLRAIRQRRAANAYLAQDGPRIAACFGDAEPMAEFTPRELQLMRFVLDRALQPLPSFEGFEWIDQYQTAAVRYQLNFMGYALSMAQATRLPALRGYLEEAQRRLILKQTDHRIWAYWASENLWGNLSFDLDPVARDNIMYTGFCATQIAMFHAASGRRDFERPRSFALRHPWGCAFYHDFLALVHALERGYRRSAFTLIACEPNWIYPLCNTIGAAALKASDAQRGSGRWASHAASFRRRLETEFVDSRGRIVPCRSTLTGFALPAIGGAQPQAMPVFFMNATMPDLALRQWLLLRRDLLDAAGALRRRAFWRIDTGNYGFSRAAAFAGTALAAAEVGDAEVAALCLSALEEECAARVEDGVLHRPDASAWAHAVELMARSTTRNAFRRIVEEPRRAALRPAIGDVRYPDVIAARAVERGGALAAVLYPGCGPGRHRVPVCGLAPNARYACDGAEERSVIADAQGDATISLILEGRTELRIRPAV